MDPSLPPAPLNGALPSRLDARTIRLSALVLLGALVFQYGPQALSLGEKGLELWANVWWIVTPGLAAALSFLAAARSGGDDRAAWGRIGLGCAAWAGGTVIWLLTGMGYPGPAEVAYLLSCLFIVRGMYLFCRVHALGWIQLGNFALALSAVAIALLLLLLPFMQASVLDPVGTAVAFTYPVAWFGATAFGIMCLVSDMPPGKRPILRLLIAGTLAQALSDLFYGLQLTGSSYRIGAIFDNGWVVGFLLFAWAAYECRRGAAAEEPRTVPLEQTTPPSTLDALVPAVAVFFILAAVAIFGLREAGAVFALFIPLALIFAGFLGVRERLMLLLERRLQREARRSREELSFVLENAIDHAIVFDAERRPVYMNQQARTFFQAIGQDDPWTAFPAAVRERLDGAVRDEAEQGRTTRFEGFLPAAKIWADMNAFSSDGRLSVIFRDVTEQHRERQKLEHEAEHDPLTGLLTRTAFRRQLAESCRGPATEEFFALLFLDLDHFKRVNDTLGHAAGDALLIEMANRMRGCVRKSDTICRLGGDEFLILLAAPTSEIEAASLARRLLDAIGRPCELGEASATVGASIGIALGTAPDSDERLLQAADAALYRAKAAGRATFRFSSPAEKAPARAITA